MEEEEFDTGDTGDLGRRGFILGGGALALIAAKVGLKVLRANNRRSSSAETYPSTSGGAAYAGSATGSAPTPPRTMSSARLYLPRSEDPAVSVRGTPSLRLLQSGLGPFSQTVTIDAEGKVVNFKVHGGAPGNLPRTLQRMSFEGGPKTFELVWEEEQEDNGGREL